MSVVNISAALVQKEFARWRCVIFKRTFLRSAIFFLLPSSWLAKIRHGWGLRESGNPAVSELPLICVFQGRLANEEGSGNLKPKLRRGSNPCSDRHHRS